jgi:hypothetical protein
MYAYIFTNDGVAVSWRSRRQTMLTKFTMEAELVALESTTIEADWLKEHLMDLLIVSCLTSTLFFFVPNWLLLPRLECHVKPE